MRCPLLHRRALAVLEAHPGDSHLDIARSRQNLVAVHCLVQPLLLARPVLLAVAPPAYLPERSMSTSRSGQPPDGWMRGEGGRGVTQQVAPEGTPTAMRHVRPEEDASFLPGPDAADRARC